MRLVALCIVFLLIGCASNPLITGEPQDWVGKRAEDLKAALGEPSKVIQQQSEGAEYWEYIEEGTYQREHRSPGTYRNVTRYRIKDGKVRAWFVERSEDGRVVFRDS